MTPRTVYEVPQSVLDDLSLIKALVLSLAEKEKKYLPNEPVDAQWMTADAFLKTIGVKKTWFHRHKHQLNTRKLSRKVYVARSEVDRYFNGEIA